MKAPIAAASIVGTVGVGAIGYAGYQSASNGEPFMQAISREFSGLVSTLMSANPLYRNSADGLPTQDQILAWCRKVGRPSPVGINIVRRVKTEPYINARSDVPCDLMGFIRLTSETLSIGMPGAACLAVLLSVETWAGVPGKGNDPPCYNNNPGNFKMGTVRARASSTVPCWFLVDRHPSLDFYPAYPDMESGIRGWSSATFGNSRYNQYGTMEALNRGDIRAFCRAIGRAGYASFYASNPRALDARAHYLMRTGKFQSRSGKATIDSDVGIVFNDSIG